MTVTLIHVPPPCHCGYVSRGLSVRQVRVNKRSMATVGLGLAIIPRHCKECGAPTGGCERVTYHLTADDAAKVDAYRRRRGWLR